MQGYDTQTEPNIKSPIFILGAPRSGTTLLRLILNAHSDIGMPEELHFFRSHMFGINIEDWQTPIEANDDNLEFLSQAVDFMQRDTQHNFLAGVIGDLYDQPTLELKDIYERLGRAFAHKNGKSVWGEKTPENILYADVLAQMFPEAAFIILHRDPRAVISSMNRVPFYPDDTYQNIMNLIFYKRYGYERAEASISDAHKMHVSYEELITNPWTQIEKICAFSGVDLETSMMFFHENSATSMSQNMQSSYNARALSPISAGQLNAWQSKLSPSEIYAICTAFYLPERAEWAAQLGQEDVQAVHDQLDGAKKNWMDACAAHPCTRDFQMRNPSQSINSNDFSYRIG